MIIIPYQVQSAVRRLRLPLTALTYTNEVLIIFLGLGSLSLLTFAVFSEEIHEMSFMLVEINQQNNAMLNEKLDVILVDETGSGVAITIVNYGKHDSAILGIVSAEGKEYECTSNNENQTNTIPAESSTEFLCDTPGDSIYYIITETRQILEAIP